MTNTLSALKSFLLSLYSAVFRRRTSKSVKLAANSSSDEEGLFFKYLPYIFTGALGFAASWYTMKQELKSEIEKNDQHAITISSLKERVTVLEVDVSWMKNRKDSNGK